MFRNLNAPTLTYRWGSSDTMHVRRCIKQIFTSEKATMLSLRVNYVNILLQNFVIWLFLARYMVACPRKTFFKRIIIFVLTQFQPSKVFLTPDSFILQSATSETFTSVINKPCTFSSKGSGRKHARHSSYSLPETLNQILFDSQLAYISLSSLAQEPFNRILGIKLHCLWNSRNLPWQWFKSELGGHWWSHTVFFLS